MAQHSAGNDTFMSLNLVNESLTIQIHTGAAGSVQCVCEAVALMIKALSYLVRVVRNVAVLSSCGRSFILSPADLSGQK